MRRCRKLRNGSGWATPRQNQCAGRMHSHGTRHARNAVVLDRRRHQLRPDLRQPALGLYLDCGCRAARMDARGEAQLHRRAYLAVWEVWSNRVRMRVTGTSDFAKRFANKLAPVNHDIHWVMSGQHWSVKVKKMPPGKFHQSEVLWNQHIIRLGSNDFRLTTIGSGASKRRYSVVAHEHGHSAGNTWALKRGDEYPKPGQKPGPHVNNAHSIMHTGDQLYARHFRTLIDHLNQTIPNTSFGVGAIK